MRFSTYAHSSTGGRANNEDYLLHKDGIWVVADGLGGHECGEVASKLASEVTVQTALSRGNSLTDDSLMEIIHNANSAVMRKQAENIKYKEMRTTIVFCLSNGTQLRFANVGDSRFYYFKNGHLVIQSTDHSVSALSAKLGDIRYEDIRTDADRSKLLKVLGNADATTVKLPEIVINPEKGDAFLLCSDGFWEYVYESEMEMDLIKSTSSKQWLKSMLKRIILRTKHQNNDNYTAIAVTVTD